MTTLNNKYSRILHILTILCFLLPFFYRSCGPSASEKRRAEEKKLELIAAEDSILQSKGSSISTAEEEKLELIAAEDSVFQSESSSTSPENQEVDLSENTTSPDGHDTNIEKEDEFFTSKKLTDKFPFLKIILLPKEDTYTGLGAIVNAYPYVSYFATFISFLLLIISLTVKFIEVAARKTVILLEIIAIIFQFFAYQESEAIIAVYNKTLWGYWVCLGFLFLLITYDFALLRKKRKNV